jgi:hypothetical protein
MIHDPVASFQSDAAPRYGSTRFHDPAARCTRVVQISSAQGGRRECRVIPV